MRPVGAESFREGGRTGGPTKLIVAFRNFVNAPKNLKQSRLCAVMNLLSKKKNNSSGYRIVFVPDVGQPPREMIGAPRI